MRSVSNARNTLALADRGESLFCAVEFLVRKKIGIVPVVGSRRVGGGVRSSPGYRDVPPSGGYIVFLTARNRKATHGGWRGNDNYDDNNNDNNPNDASEKHDCVIRCVRRPRMERTREIEIFFRQNEAAIRVFEIRDRANREQVFKKAKA